MFNKFRYRKALKMIAHFDALIADADANPDKYVGWQHRNRNLAWDDPQTQKSLQLLDKWLAKLIRMAPWPKKSDLEGEQMQELLHEEWKGESLSRPELLALIRKYPPEVLETVLPCVMVMYLLRETDLEFDSDTKAFGKFFDGWHYMVIKA